ncbi:MAG: endonuclease/exonuclease/phosphatase family protein, partial [Planctomycetota bacterium]
IPPNTLSPDLLLVVEIDEPWFEALAEVRGRYPHRVECVRGDGLGIALWSRLELGSPSVSFLVSDRRPSVWARVMLPGAKTVRFVGLHPTPPGLEKPHEDDRFDSDNRDEELAIVARRVADSENNNENDLWLVAGDLNDVAWSRTTAQFKRRSGLVDPRVGRGFVNSFHAQYPLLRYPLDHVFFSQQIGLAAYKRFRLPGSDHFGLRADLAVAHDDLRATTS